MENRFDIKPYPAFNEVFADDELKGVFIHYVLLWIKKNIRTKPSISFPQMDFG